MKTSKFALSTVVLLLLSVSGWASDKMKAKIQIDQTVHVGSTQLAPGEYVMTWTESGSNAEVTFSQGKKVIAIAPAQATHKASGYDGPAIHINSGSKTLTEVELPKVSLSFNGENSVPTNPSN
jgi:hypothetical protein